jgi:hypothetical protein
LLLLSGSVRSEIPEEELFRIGPGFKAVYSASADYLFASDAITNQFAQTYYQKGFISNSLKDEVSGNLFGRNRFGGAFNTGITVAQKLDTLFGTAGGSSYINLSHRVHLHSKFRDDLFEIFFRGNKMYKDEIAELGPFEFSTFTYQQLTYGIEKQKTSGNKKLIWNAGLSLNIGQKLNDFHSDHASLYTSRDGSFLDIEMDLRIRQNDSSQNDLGSFNGFGFSGSGSLIIKDENQNAWSFSAQNLGYIFWTKESAEIPVDSSFRFEGIEVDDLFDFGDSIDGRITNDSTYVQEFLSRREKKSFTTMLPFRLKASYSGQLRPGKVILQIGAETYLFNGSSLRGFSNLRYNFKSRHQLVLHVSYGGYTFWNLGLAYHLQAGKSWIIDIGSDHLSSMINKENGLSQGAFVSLSKYF